MCFELPSKIVSIKDKKATVDCFGRQSEVDLIMIDDLKIGDYVLVRGDYAVSKIDKKEAKEVLDLLKIK